MNQVIWTQDAELQLKIEREIKMRDGIAKLLAASKHNDQLMEAAKNMLVSNTRVLSYMSELQRRKSEEILQKDQPSPARQEPCRAKVAISDIRIPLMWKDTDHFKNKGDHRRYAVFCLVKIGTDIYDTVLLKDIDRSKTDICFEDVLVFASVPHDFSCSLEVYSHQLLEDVSIASTPKKIKKKINEISSSVGRTVGRRLSGLKEEEIMNSLLVGPRFDQIAHATLALTEVKDSVGTYDLILDNTDNGRVDTTSSVELPLFENFCCQISAQPRSLVENVVEGCLDIEQNVSSGHVSASSGHVSASSGHVSVTWRRYWCALKNRQISCWLNAGSADECEPDLAIPLTKYTAIAEEGATTSSRDHCIHVIYSSCHGGKFVHVLSADGADVYTKWWDGLQQHLLDQALWKQACEKLMEIKAPIMRYKRTTFNVRKGSLYDEIPGSIDSGPEDSWSVDSRSSSSQDSASSPSWRESRSALTRHGSRPEVSSSSSMGS